MLTARTAASYALGVLMLASTMLASSNAADADTKVSTFKLENGMDVVVIPDRRAPVVTHMVWYRVGAADEPEGKSGIAHFLEHLMFKSTKTMASGEFSKTVSRLGGQDNAFTSQDATAYFQRIGKAQLPTVMKMEADRMVNLVLDPKEVRTERDVILEERRSRVENSPSSLLSEQMDAALYLAHPYRIPVIGWMHEIAQLDHEDAIAFYKRHYAPNNAILIVAGDVEADAVLELAKQTYGKIPSNPAIVARERVKEPPQRAPRRLVLRDERAAKPIFRRSYVAPSYQSASDNGEAEALDLMMKVFASGSTSMLYKALVVDQQIASSISGYYAGHGLDYGKIIVSAVPTPGVSLEKLEAAIDAEIAKLLKGGIDASDLERAKRVYTAEYIYEIDSQSSLARRYGWGLVVGATTQDIETWPEEIKKVTPEAAHAVAKKYFDINASVTGYLLPAEPENAASNAGATPANDRS
jgi:zinc protease